MTQIRLGTHEETRASLGPFSKRPVRVPPQWATTFQSGHGWTAPSGGTFSDDTSDYVLGSQSVELITTGNGAIRQVRKLGMSNMDITGKTIRLVLKVVGLSHVSTLALRLGDTSLTNYFEVTVWNPGDTKATLEGEWTTLDFNFNAASLATETGSPDLSTITDIAVLVYDDGAAPVTVNLNAVGFVPESSAFPNGVVTFGFDDCYVSHFTEGRKKLDQYGFAATEFAIADVVGASGTYLSLAQLNGLRDNSGWEIAGHCYSADNHTTRLTNLSASELDDDLYQMRNWLAENGFGESDHFAYPGGAWNTTVEAATRKYFSSARLTAIAQLPTVGPARPHRIPSRAVTSATSTASLQTAIDRAYANKNWLILPFHKIVTTTSGSDDYSIANFGTIVDYVATKGIAVRTMGEVMASL